MQVVLFEKYWFDLMILTHFFQLFNGWCDESTSPVNKQNMKIGFESKLLIGVDKTFF